MLFDAGRAFFFGAKKGKVALAVNAHFLDFPTVRTKHLWFVDFECIELSFEVEIVEYFLCH